MVDMKTLGGKISPEMMKHIEELGGRISPGIDSLNKAGAKTNEVVRGSIDALHTGAGKVVTGAVKGAVDALPGGHKMTQRAANAKEGVTAAFARAKDTKVGAMFAGRTAQQAQAAGAQVAQTTGRVGTTFARVGKVGGVAMKSFAGVGAAAGVYGALQRKQGGNLVGNNIMRLGQVLQSTALVVDFVPIPLLSDMTAATTALVGTAFVSAGHIANGQIRTGGRMAVSGAIDSAILLGPSPAASVANIGAAMMTGHTVGGHAANALFGKEAPADSPTKWQDTVKGSRANLTPDRGK